MTDMHNNWSINLITIQYIINWNYHKKDGKLNNNVYIQATLERDGMESIILPIDPEGCIWGYDPHIDYENNLQWWSYKAITEKLSTKIFNRIAEKI